MENNTVRLIRGEGRFTKDEWKKFKKGELVVGFEGCEYAPEELGRWSIDQADEARAALAKVRCYYSAPESGGWLGYAEEYALEWFAADEDGEFVSGSDYDLAEEEERHGNE